DVQFQRMPNINLMPHPDRDVTLDELVGDVQRGILIDGDGSFSIDQQRYNAQFGGQTFREIRNGRIEGMLKDGAYQIRTPEFWNAMDLCGGQSTYFQGGAFGDGKGQPSQSNAVSHACPATRHRQITVINTARSVCSVAYLTEVEARALTRRVLELSQADHCRVNIRSSMEANTRFAQNQMSTSGDIHDTTMTVNSAFGRQVASSTTNRFDDDGLEQVVRTSEALARLAPEDEEYLGELGPQQYPSSGSFYESTANLEPEERARAIA